MRKVELLPTRDCEAGYGPDKISLKENDVSSCNTKYSMSISSDRDRPTKSLVSGETGTFCLESYSRVSISEEVAIAAVIGHSKLLITQPSCWYEL